MYEGSTISRSYAAGLVDGTGAATYPSAGLVGLSEGDNLIAYSFALGRVEGDAGNTAGVAGGEFGEDTLTLVGDAFDVMGTGQTVCRFDTPEDFTGCDAVADGPVTYWNDTATLPLNHFNAADVWDFNDRDALPALRPYDGPEPEESDDPDPAGDSGDGEEEAAPAPRHRSGSSSLSSGQLAALGIRLAPAAPAPAQAPQPAAPASPARDLALGMAGDDVRQLQQLLNADGFAVAQSGPGSPGHETATFGALTRAALARYQRAHGIAPAAGYFGPVTRAQMKAAGLGAWW